MFNRIVLINLDKRKDRLGSMQAKLSACKSLSGWVRQRAVHGDSVGCPQWFVQGPGAWGCARSHLRVLEDAISDGLDSILILEDDAIFADDFDAKLAQFMSLVPTDWDGIMFGGQNQSPATPTGIPGISRSVNTQRTHAYAVRGQKSMRKLYSIWSRCDVHIDWWLAQWQGSFTVYQPEPFLIGQDAGPSDISGRLDAVRFWRGSNTQVNGPLESLRVLDCPAAVARQLRMLGVHQGNWRCKSTDRDMGLIEIEGQGWHVDRLRQWVDLIRAEAVELGDVPGLWHDPMPMIWLQDRLPRPFEIVKADTIDKAVAQIPQVQTALRASRVYWVYRGKGAEILEGLKHYGWHRGNTIDPITGLDQGIRAAVESQEMHRLPAIVGLLAREASAIRRGKVLIAHPDLNVDAVQELLPSFPVVELVGDEIGQILQSAQKAMES